VRILITGVTGFIGSALAARLAGEGHELLGASRRPQAAAHLGIPLARVDVVSGEGLAQALAGVHVAYYLIHSMEPAADGRFEERERLGAQNFAAAARAAGVRRIVYLGGPMPSSGRISRHLASRLAVEEILLKATRDSVAFRASIVIGARSRSFRFLVRLVERLPVIAIPAWGGFRSSPIDERDAIELLARAATSPRVSGLSLDLRGAEIVTYRQLIEGIVDALLVSRTLVDLPGPTLTPLTSAVAAAIASEEPELIGPLMESLQDDLLPRDDRAAALLGVRLHRLSSAIEHALRQLEALEELRAR
jgi:uncharacterized protein YbjT (DUF2867 family)